MNFNRYRILEDGSFTFHTFKEGQNFNKDAWLENDGRFEKKLETITGINEDGTEYNYQIDTGYYTYYNEDGTPDLAKEQEATDAKLKEEAERLKEETLARLTVTTTSGKVFYADSDSRIDLQEAIRIAIETNQTSTIWKLAEDFEGARIVSVALDEIKEASMLALLTKGEFVGAVTESVSEPVIEESIEEEINNEIEEEAN